MLAVIFSNLEYHFRPQASKEDEIDEVYFTNFQDETIREMYDNMRKYTHNTAVICNLIYQMLKRNPENVDLIMAAVIAIEYQNSKMQINKRLYSLTENCVQKNKDKLLSENLEDLNSLRLLAYFGNVLSTPEHEPIYSFKMF